MSLSYYIDGVLKLIDYKCSQAGYKMDFVPALPTKTKALGQKEALFYQEVQDVLRKVIKYCKPLTAQILLNVTVLNSFDAINFYCSRKMEDLQKKELMGMVIRIYDMCNKINEIIFIHNEIEEKF